MPSWSELLEAFSVEASKKPAPYRLAKKRKGNRTMQYLLDKLSQ